MSLSHEERRLLGDLASGAIDGALTEVQQQQLEQLLRTSEEARIHYVRFMEISAGLAWASRGALPVAAEPAPRVRRWRWYPAVAAALILVATIAAAWALRQKPEPPPPASEGVAFLSTAVNIEWEGSQEPLHVGNVLKPDWMRVKSGLAQIELISGASVWLEGPATMRLDGGNGGYCASGKIVAVVPKGSEGLHLDTPLGSVADHGTGFGVDVTPGKVAIHIFEGRVDVTPTGGATKSYFAGQSVALLPGGTMLPGRADASVFDYLGYGWNEGYMAWDRWAPHPWQTAGSYANSPWDWSPYRVRWPMPPTWKGGNPLDFIRDQLGVDADRWAALEPKIGAYLDAQRVMHGEGYPWDNDVARAFWGLELSTMNVYADDEELRNGLMALRDARQVAQDKLDAAEKALKQSVTVAEEARLETMGYLK
jgi:hypothetical protein